MKRPDNNKTVKNNSSWITRILGTFLFGPKFQHQEPIVDPWVESHTEQPFSGGYNEAFVIQFWTSYNLK